MRQQAEEEWTTTRKAKKKKTMYWQLKWMLTIQVQMNINNHNNKQYKQQQ